MEPHHVILLIFLLPCTLSTTPDPNGYVIFCPCMGRFGNQMDQYLGSLAFIKALNRTVVLPPFIEYPPGHPGSRMVPFGTYFKVDAIQKFHRAITMEDFMESLADEVWPAECRSSFCFRARSGNGDCAAKQGNPFGPFWNNFNIDFVSSTLFGPLHYDIVDQPKLQEDWKRTFPPETHPVLAFTGAPGAFPVQQKNLHIQEHFVFSESLKSKANDFIYDVRASLAELGPFLGIHLRNGVDWKTACSLTKESPLLFSAPQCFGYRGEIADPPDQLRERICLPGTVDVLQQISETVKSTKAKWVFVAADHDHLVPEIEYFLRKLNTSVRRYPENNPLVDLAVLTQANHFIGNCFSSFSAFVKRHRDVHGLPSSFWLLDQASRRSHDEF